MKIIFSFALLFGATVYLASCSGSLPAPDASQVEWASQKWTGTSIHELRIGRQLYIEKCSGCHSLRSPANYSEKEWQKILPEMNTKAGVKENEGDLIMKYVITASETRNSVAKR